MLEESTRNADLWRSACLGDQDAADRVVQIAQEVLASELRARGVRGQELDGLLQTSLETVLTLLRERTEVRDLRAFLKYRAWGVLSDHRKQARRRRERPIDEAMDSPAHGPDVEHRAVRAELAGALHECVGGLQPDVRRVVEMRYADEHTCDEIAAVLGIERPTVYVRWFRGMRALRTCLEKKGFESWDLE